MLMLLSPAKKLDFENCAKTSWKEEPALIKRSAILNRALKKLSAEKLRKLHNISSALAELNFSRNQAFSVPFERKAAKPALFAFQGDVYKGLEAESLSKSALKKAEASIRILSGLYGLLRPFDGILPYRLEMGTELKGKWGKNLYSFWGDSITDLINQELVGAKDPVVVNLASHEYFKAIQKKRLKARLVNIHFKEIHKGNLKVISFNAKKARGLMARYALNMKSNKVENLKKFDLERYQFSEELSKESDWVFTRKFIPVSELA